MAQIVGVMAAMAAILVAAGWVFCALLPAGWRDRLLPGLPVLGVVILVLVFHWTGLLLSTDQSLIVLAVGFLAATPLAIRRTVQWRPSLRKVLVCAALPLAAVPAAYAGLIPVHRGLRVVQVTPNNDAYAYVTLSDWFQRHSVLETPRVPPDAPAYSYPKSHLDQQLRVGEEFLQAAGATVTGREPDRTWYVLAALWLLLFPSSMAAAASVLGLPPLAGAVAGGVAASSSIVLMQLFNQNSASLLGIAVAPLVFALLVARLRGSDDAAPPRWLVAAFVAALFGIYSEYLPMAVLVIGLLVVSPPFHILRRSRDALIVGGLTALICPLAASKVVRSFLLERGLSIGQPYDAAAFLGVTPLRFADRLFGLIPLNGTEDGASPRLAVFVGVLLVGLIALLIIRAPARPYSAVVPAAAAVVYYLDKVHPFPYAHQRAIDISWPIVVCAACLGLAQLVRLAVRRWGIVPTVAAALVVPLSAGAFIATNVDTSTAYSRGPWIPDRTVDASFDEAMGWIRGVQENRGANVMVCVVDFFGQLWTVFGFRELDQAAFPFLYKDYVPNIRSSPALGIWDGALRRYLLVDTAAFMDAGPGVVVRKNKRFKLLDLSRGEATVGIPVTGFHHREIAESGPRYWMSDSGRLLLIRTPGGRATLVLRAAAVSDLGSVPLEVRAEPTALLSGAPTALSSSETLGRATVSTAGTDVKLALPPAVAAELVLVNGKAAVRPADGSSPDPESIHLEALLRK